MTRTLIINPPFLEPHRPPISCAIIGEVARLQGHDVSIIDINIELFQAVGNDKFLDHQTEYLFNSNTAIQKELNDFVISQLQPDFINQFDWILVSCFSNWEYPMTAMIVEYCKKNSFSKIVIGGPGVHVKGQTLLDQKHVDYWVAGEGEVALAELFKGNTTYPGINGVPPVQIDDVENLPLPNYNFFDLKKYDWLLDSPDVFIYGSRGCVRKCTFCDIASYWPKFRYRSGQSVADEMIMNYEQHGIKNFYFADSLLNGNLKEFRSFLDKLSRYPDAKGFRWGGYAIIRSKKSHPAELFDQIGAAGGQFFSIGIETGVDRIRLDMKKQFTNDDIEWHLEQSQRIKLQNIFLMITSWYDETLAEHHEYLKIFKRWQHYAADGTIFGISINPPLIILPNTPLRSLLDDDQVFLENDIKDSLQSLAWVNTKLPELTFQERYRRAVAITKEADKYNWNIQNKQTKLNEIKLALQSYLNNKPKNPSPVIPIKRAA